MPYLPWIVLLALLLAGGCNNLPTAGEAGLVTIAPNIYVEPEMDGAGRAYLLQTVADAQHAIGVAYGNVLSHPPVYACISTACYVRMGGSDGTTAEALDDRLVLSPQGLDWHFLAHEWSHIELFTRLTPAAWQRIPQWFNEGLAVTISREPRYSEQAWQFIQANHLPYPSEQELYSLTGLYQWGAAVRHYNAQNPLHQVHGAPEVAAVYTAAGHVVRPWLNRAGNDGLNRFIQRMNAGAPFADAFDQVY
jgi:hypothetical protein